jgi:hypothetical protein
VLATSAIAGEVPYLRSEIRVDASHVYVRGANNVFRIPKAGGTAEALLAPYSTNGLMTGFHVSDGHLYYTDDGGYVVRAPIAGGPPVEITKDQNGLSELLVASGFVWFLAVTSDHYTVLKKLPIPG